MVPEARARRRIVPWPSGRRAIAGGRPWNAGKRGGRGAGRTRGARSAPACGAGKGGAFWTSNETAKGQRNAAEKSSPAARARARAQAGDAIEHVAPSGEALLRGRNGRGSATLNGGIDNLGDNMGVQVSERQNTRHRARLQRPLSRGRTRERGAVESGQRSLVRGGDCRGAWWAFARVLTRAGRSTSGAPFAQARLSRNILRWRVGQSFPEAQEGACRQGRSLR